MELRKLIRKTEQSKWANPVADARTQPSQDATIQGIQLKVRAGSQPLPEPLVGAYVFAFSIAAEPREAVVTSVRALQAMGYDFEDVLSEALSMPLSDWGSYIERAWPEFSAEFPQSEVAARLANGGVVFSPFAGFEREA